MAVGSTGLGSTTTSLRKAAAAQPVVVPCLTSYHFLSVVTLPVAVTESPLAIVLTMLPSTARERRFSVDVVVNSLPWTAESVVTGTTVLATGITETWPGLTA